MLQQKELTHKRAIRQIGPTCGYYALINGMHYWQPKTIRNHKWHKTGSDKHINVLLSLSKRHLPYTVGELFNNQIFYQIIKEWSHPNIQSVELIERGNTLDELEASDGVFYLMPIYRPEMSRKKQERANSHWLCIIPKANKQLIVLDSNNRSKKRYRTKTDLNAANMALDGKVFRWDDWLKSQPKNNKLRYGGLLDRYTHRDVTRTLDAFYEATKKCPIQQQSLNKKQLIKITMTTESEG